ncbi:hypothetical protein B484DRAFT_324105, partial [Ochromonadaceae sp. CCMP2298]
MQHPTPLSPLHLLPAPLSTLTFHSSRPTSLVFLPCLCPSLPCPCHRQYAAVSDVQQCLCQCIQCCVFLCMCGYVWVYVGMMVCMTIYEYVWVCVGMCGYIWVCVGMCGYVWVCVGMCWYVWVYMGMCGYVW